MAPIVLCSRGALDERRLPILGHMDGSARAHGVFPGTATGRRVARVNRRALTGARSGSCPTIAGLVLASLDKAASGPPAFYRTGAQWFHLHH